MACFLASEMLTSPSMEELLRQLEEARADVIRLKSQISDKMSERAQEIEDVELALAWAMTRARKLIETDDAR